MMDLNNLKQSTIAHLCFAITYCTSGFIINVLQAILYLGLRPFSKKLYRKINYYLIFSYGCELAFMTTWWAGVKLKIYIKKEDYEKYFGKEHGFLIMNHSYEMDWLMIWQLGDGIGGVLGNCKAYAKKSLSYIPPIGWICKFGEFVFLERSFDRDRDNIKRQISEICDYPDPVWLLMMAEGTRYTPKKHEASVKFAEEKGLPILQHHLTPRTKGFTISLISMRGKIPAIYNIQLAFQKDSKVQPTMMSLLYGKELDAHMYIERIPLEAVPLEEEAAAKWLHELYIKKDKMQASFLNTGDFFRESGEPPVESFVVPKTMYSFLNMLFWAVTTLTFIVYYLLRLLLNGELLHFSVACAIFGAFHIILQKSLGMAKISQASSYGAEKKTIK